MMVVNPYRLAAAAATYWNPSDVQASAVLSVGNTQINRAVSSPPPGTSGRAVKSLSGVSKGYFEIATSANYSGPVGDQMGGICTSTSLLDKTPANLNVTGNYVLVADGSQWWRDDVYQGTHAGGGWGDGSGARVKVMAIAYDANTRAVAMYDNGVLRINTTLSGTNPAFPFATIEDTLNQAFGLVLRVKTSEFTYTPPSGYSAWADV